MPERKRLEPVAPDPKDIPVKFDILGIDSDKHEEFRKGILEAARVAVDDFPTVLERVCTTLRESSALDALAAFACYSSWACVKEDGSRSEALPDVMQHHAELLHALILSLPSDQLSSGIITPRDMGKLFDDVPLLTEAFSMRRILDSEDIHGDDEALLVRSLQERVRLHTLGVRNWGYFEHVVEISTALYSALDGRFAARYGFTASDVIDILETIEASFKKKLSEHFALLMKVVRGNNAAQIARNYYRLVPDLKGTADELLADLPKNITRQDMSIMIMAHMDLRLINIIRFSTEEIAGLTGKPVVTVSGVLNQLSLTAEALADTQPEYFFLDNPVWEKPVIAMEAFYLFPLPQSAFSHIHRIMNRLAEDADLNEVIEARRAAFLEERVVELFTRALPGANIRPSAVWHKNGGQFENDLVIVFDRVVVIAEAKSNKLTASGLRGAPARVKRHVRNMVLDPSVQSARLEALIDEARAGDEVAKKELQTIGIDAGKADRVIRISVTLHDLSVLSSAEGDLKKVGWVPQEHDLAPTILITDLACIADILENPVHFLHYLSERFHFQKGHDLLGDELDFLGMYLETAFNIDPRLAEAGTLTIPEMSAVIDRYYGGVSTGLKVQKPMMKLRPLFRKIVKRLAKNKTEGWTLLGFHILASADYAEQRAIERSLERLRRSVRKNHKKPDHTCLLVVRPPDDRKAAIIFYLFPRQHMAVHRKIMSEKAFCFMKEQNLKQCVVLARCTESWGQAFETAMIASEH